MNNWRISLLKQFQEESYHMHGLSVVDIYAPPWVGSVKSYSEDLIVIVEMLRTKTSIFFLLKNIIVNILVVSLHHRKHFNTICFV